MKIAVVGAGYVGLVQAVGLADVGYEVVCIDIDTERVNLLKGRRAPIYEPGLEELLERYTGKSLQFTDEYSDIADADVIFVCVQTPATEDGACDISVVERALRDVGVVVREDALVVVKSSTPPGTLVDFERALGRPDVRIAVNPEFLREGTSLKDFFQPDRTVVGVKTHRDELELRELYHFLKAPFLAMNIPSAQLVKYASNTMLALRLSYINEIANISAVTGAHIKDVEQAIGMDPRIGSAFLRSGAGFGGSCFPKDVLALQRAGEKAGYRARLISPIIDINVEQPLRFVGELEKVMRLEAGVRVAVWGLAFNKGTDDVRQSPAIRIVQELIKRGVYVMAHDPKAEVGARKELGDSGWSFVARKEDALEGAEALLVLTEWPEYIEADYGSMRDVLVRPIIGDGKHALNHWALRRQGFTVIGIGL